MLMIRKDKVVWREVGNGKSPTDPQTQFEILGKGRRTRKHLGAPQIRPAQADEYSVFWKHSCNESTSYATTGWEALGALGMAARSLSKHWSFPRKRKATRLSAHFLWFAESVPAFVGMTVPESAFVSQMTPLPSGNKACEPIS